MSTTNYAFPPSYPPTSMYLPQAYPPQQAYPPAYPPQTVYPSAPPDDIYYHDCPLQLPKETLEELIETCDISSSLSQAFYIVKEKFDIVLVWDNSGSMNKESSYVDEKGVTINTTRWGESCKVMESIVRFATTVDTNGVDVYFFDNERHIKVHNVDDIRKEFTNSAPKSNTLTPIVQTLRRIQADFKENSKDVLIVIVTDGLPMATPIETVENLKSTIIDMIQIPEPKFRISVVLATNDDAVVQMYNEIDDDLDYFDVSDDYTSEKQEIIAKQGPSFKFRYGDYILKILLGSICLALDKLDKELINMNQLVKKFTENFDKYGLYYDQKTDATPATTYENPTRYYEKQNACCTIM